MNIKIHKNRATYMAEKNLTKQERLMELDARQREHEAMCEERWKTCFNRLETLDEGVGRLETLFPSPQQHQFHSQSLQQCVLFHCFH